MINSIDPRVATFEYPAKNITAHTQRIVLLHGWGLNHLCWQAMVAELSEHHHLILVDLPGFGASQPLADYSLEALLNVLQPLFSEPAVVMGWSLGGMLAVQLAARLPHAITSVITLAANLHFTCRADWPYGLEVAVSQSFSAAFKQDANATLKRFAGLLAQGDQTERGLLKTLRQLMTAESLMSQGEQALLLLNQLNNVSVIKTLTQPVLHIFGDADALVPLSASQAIAALVPRQQVQVVSGAGHALLFSCAETVNALVKDFLLPSRPSKQQIAQCFSKAASSYDSAAAIQRVIGTELLSLMVEQENIGVVVDVGAGTGYFTEQLTQRFPNQQIIGIDLSPAMLHQGYLKRAAVKYWLAGDAECLPLANQSVDILFSNLAIQWSANLTALFSEWARVLAPSGEIYVATLGPRTLYELRETFISLKQPVPLLQFAYSSDIKRAIAAAGLTLASFTKRDSIDFHSNFSSLMRSLKQVGATASSATPPIGLAGRKKWQQLAEHYQGYRQGDYLPATYDVYYMRLTKSQA